MTTKIEKVDRWEEVKPNISRRVRTYKVNGVEYKLLREAKAAAVMPVITKCEAKGGHRTSSLRWSLTPAEIERRLGFDSDEFTSEPEKVTYEWHFEVDGVYCSIWDWYGCRWSAFGPKEALAKVFPEFVE